MNPKVSISIATYNKASTLRYAIESILNQTYSDFELIVVGDCCTDNSAEVVRAFNDHRVQWHNLETNSGNQIVPNNHAISIAQGEFIAYLGHDDLWMPNHLEGMVEGIEDADFAYSAALVFEENKLRLTGVSRKSKYVYSMALPTSSFMHSTSLGLWWRTGIKQFAEDSRVLPSDQDLVIRIVDLDRKIISVPQLTVLKFLSKNGTSCKEQAEAMRKMKEEPDFLFPAITELLYASYDDKCISKVASRSVESPLIPKDVLPPMFRG